MSTTTTQQEESSLLPLGRVFGSTTAKVMDFLLANQKFDYAESDISRLASIPARTLQRAIPQLLDEGLIRRTRKSGKAFMYEANLDSKRTQALLEYIKATRIENLQRLK
jgi:predicted transcriptional regulator